MFLLFAKQLPLRQKTWLCSIRIEQVEKDTTLRCHGRVDGHDLSQKNNRLVVNVPVGEVSKVPRLIGMNGFMRSEAVNVPSF